MEGGQTLISEHTYRRRWGDMGFPLFLLSAQEYDVHGQVEANNNTAGTPLNSGKPIMTVKLIFFFQFIKHD